MLTRFYVLWIIKFALVVACIFVNIVFFFVSKFFNDKKSLVTKINKIRYKILKAKLRAEKNYFAVLKQIMDK